MKQETRTFYEAAVERAVHTIRNGLDDALDMATLARTCALSSFHFHRVFRGMLGETPIEMHRRLRLERAARQLLSAGLPITRIAFDAGYETHEAFTRAFHQAYGASPSAFRAQASAAGCARPRQTELAAPSGVHVQTAPAAMPELHFARGEMNMDVTIETKPELRVATVQHVGPYAHISDAFARLGGLAGPAGLLRYPEAAMVAIYHDDPESTPPAELRSDAGVVVPAGVELPTGLVERRIAGGRYARVTHTGPYTHLGDAWARFLGQWLPNSGHRVGQGSSYELYRNNREDCAGENSALPSPRLSRTCTVLGAVGMRLGVAASLSAHPGKPGNKAELPASAASPRALRRVTSSLFKRDLAKEGRWPTPPTVRSDRTSEAVQVTRIACNHWAPCSPCEARARRHGARTPRPPAWRSVVFASRYRVPIRIGTRTRGPSVGTRPDSALWDLARQVPHTGHALALLTREPLAGRSVATLAWGTNGPPSSGPRRPGAPGAHHEIAVIFQCEPMAHRVRTYMDTPHLEAPQDVRAHPSLRPRRPRSSAHALRCREHRR